MEIKKNVKADLEKGKSLHYLMGLVIALAVLFVGFEWGENDINVATGIRDITPDDVIEIDPTRQDPLPPPPVEPDVIKTLEIINIVEDIIDVPPVVIMPSEDYPSNPVVYIPTGGNDVEDVPAEDEIFIIVEQQPEFPGGEGALLKWIADHLVYPAIAQDNGIEGRVTCSFVVNTDGSVVDVAVVRPIDPSLDKEAVRVLKLLPKFKPGEQRKKPVRVRLSVPVRFQLQK